MNLNTPVSDDEILDMYTKLQKDFNGELTLTPEELKRTITKLNNDFMKVFTNDDKRKSD